MIDFGNFLKTAFMEWQYAQGEKKTYQQFVEYLDLKPTSFSQWMNNVRLPDIDNLKKIADKLGPETWRAAGLPEMMPENPQYKEFSAFFLQQSPEVQEMMARSKSFKRFVRFFGILTPAAQEEVADFVERTAKEREKDKEQQAQVGNEHKRDYSVSTA
jgi:transcriptional regulator with XRE-family HTH domain